MSTVVERNDFQRAVFEDYERALVEQLNRPIFYGADASPPALLRRRTRAWRRITRRPRRITLRLKETWSVLCHGLPENDW
jgi:hypothetical protein